MPVLAHATACKQILEMDHKLADPSSASRDRLLQSGVVIACEASAQLL
jgi:hypothetical protein